MRPARSSEKRGLSRAGHAADLPASFPEFPITRVLEAIARTNRSFEETSVAEVSRARDPFRVLAATILSLRTKDETTAAASRRLFEAADTPEAMLRLSARRIERLIFPVGFYRTKARTLRGISRALLERFGGKVPGSLEDLLTLKGVGRKTANLVLTLGHGRPGICVDVHVHRITNRWGYLETRDPEATEMHLRDVLPARHWMEINDILVTFGKFLCRPVSPWCSRCPVVRHCARVDVNRSR
jgi:endonuclease III